jgi:hypothetical protein
MREVELGDVISPSLWRDIEQRRAIAEQVMLNMQEEPTGAWRVEPIGQSDVLAWFASHRFTMWVTTEFDCGMVTLH